MMMENHLASVLVESSNFNDELSHQLLYGGAKQGPTMDAIMDDRFGLPVSASNGHTAMVGSQAPNPSVPAHHPVPSAGRYKPPTQASAAATSFAPGMDPFRVMPEDLAEEAEDKAMDDSMVMMANDLLCAQPTPSGLNNGCLAPTNTAMGSPYRPPPAYGVTLPQDSLLSGLNGSGGLPKSPPLKSFGQSPNMSPYRPAQSKAPTKYAPRN